jgi:hypothetical protein
MHKLIRGIKNLIKWFKTIYNDRDDDNVFLEHILYKKLCGIHKHQKQYSQHADSAKSLQALEICIAILERRLNDWYFDEIYLNSKHKYIIDESRKISFILTLHDTEKRDWKILWRLMERWGQYWWT